MRPFHPARRNGDTTVTTLVTLGVLLILGIAVWLFTQFRQTRGLLTQERARADQAVRERDEAREEAVRERRRADVLEIQLQVQVLKEKPRQEELDRQQRIRSVTDEHLEKLRRELEQDPLQRPPPNHERERFDRFRRNLELNGQGFISVEENPADLIQQGRRELNAGDAAKALQWFDRAVELAPKNAEAYFERGRAHEQLDDHKKAVADFTKSLDFDPKNIEALNHRGSERFKLGQIKESVADFDAYVKAKPAEFNGHWKRGIALYYAGRFDDGREQFEGYEKVDTNDVENAVWHFLCVARKDGVEKARAALLKIGRDRRVPMMEVYDLFAGKITPEKVLEAVERDKPGEAEQKRRLFYAHLYLGLYCEVTNDAKKALEHLSKATDLPKPHHFMWDVARVHRDLLKKK